MERSVPLNLDLTCMKVETKLEDADDDGDDDDDVSDEENISEINSRE